MNNRIRYTFDEVMRDVFYQMPKFLFIGELKKLNNDARVLYSVLKNRHELSLKNHWINENNEVYLIFSREEMCDLLGVSENTILKAMKTLKSFNLIEEERQGLGKPNKIYLLALETLENPLNRKYCGSRTAEFAEQKPQNLRPNNNELNNNYFTENESVKTSQSPIYPHQKNDLTMTDTTDLLTQQNFLETKKEPSVIYADQSTRLNESPFTNLQSNFNQYITYGEWEARVKNNIGYEYFIQERQPYIKLIDTIVHSITKILIETNDFIVLNKKENRKIRTIDAKEMCLRLKYDHILYVLEKFKNVSDPVTHKGNYLKSIILSSLDEMEAYYQNEYRQGDL